MLTGGGGEGKVRCFLYQEDLELCALASDRQEKFHLAAKVTR